MALNGITHCAERHDLWSYSCLDCGGSFYMVGARTAVRASVPERRAVLRHRVVTAGTMEFFSGGAIACMVRNLSAAGAGLDLTHPIFEIPEYFTLIADGSRLPCHVIWRRKERTGIVFEPTGAPPTCG
jgi:hypothetical protein